VPVITLTLTEEQAFVLELLSKGQAVPTFEAARQILAAYLEVLDPEDPVLSGIARLRCERKQPGHRGRN
jgi:hypothetical protein